MYFLSCLVTVKYKTFSMEFPMKTNSDVRHIKRRHGQNEEQRGQINITPADFAFIPVILNEFDTVRQIGKDKKGNKKLEFTKKIKGTFYLVSIEKGNNQIGIITLWKRKK